MTSYGTQSRYSDSSSSSSSSPFASVEGTFGDFPSYPPFSELPFSRKRRGNQPNIVKWTMRAVLASPIVVLVLWSVGAMMFANKHTGSNTQQQQQQVYKRKQRHVAPQQVLQQPQPDLALMGMAPTTDSQQPQPLQQGNMMMMSPDSQLLLQQQQVQQPLQQQQGMMIMSPDSQQQVQPNVLQASLLTQTQQQQQVESPIVQTAVETPTLGAAFKASKNKHNRPTVHHRAAPRAAQPQEQPHVLYYDPIQATQNNGQVQVPDTVYDSAGNPIPLLSLRGSQIFMEPPQVLPTERTLSMSTENIQKWGESTAQDQSIIVATVAVMALLVGALSARRMRSRSFLSACIENESLEDDMAYDTAYTTSHNKDSSSYYNTFANGGWKGDLEKFDV